MPIVNLDARAAPEHAAPERAPVPERVAPPEEIQVYVGNRCEPSGDRFEWACFVQAGDVQVRCVTFHLHPTFKTNVIAVTQAPFEVAATGWGTFEVQLDVDTGAARYRVAHELSFDAPQCGAVRTARRVHPSTGG